MADEMQHKLFLAKEDFQRARRQAALEAIMARLQGRSTELLPYEEVRRKLGATGNMERGLREIPLDAIVGSVGRYSDFTRSFLPLKSNSEERWAKVKIAVTDSGFDPIEVYQLGDAYFVRDGNHRVSIARRMGSPTIPAYVTEIRTKAPFSPDMQPDDLIRQEEYANFLERTSLDEQRPEADLETTVPGRYRRLEQQIEAHQAHLRDHWNKQTTFPEAAADWYDYVYLPVARLIREKGILQDFPGRTQTDLYLWILEHRDELSQALGWDVTVEAAATTLVEQTSAQPERVIT
ncbi:MAG TPA: hypothetical protein VER55_02460, partial [Ardenticatenaceae bacterium]|nr:hypothetical protein [Ardenticatenaceae bacterium]